MKKLLVLAILLSLLGCSGSSASNYYYIGTVIVSFTDAMPNASFYVITQTPGLQGSATAIDTIEDPNETTPAPVVFYVPAASYTFSLSAYAHDTDLQNSIPPLSTVSALPSPVSVSTGSNYDLTATF